MFLENRSVFFFFFGEPDCFWWNFYRKGVDLNKLEGEKKIGNNFPLVLQQRKYDLIHPQSSSISFQVIIHSALSGFHQFTLMDLYSLCWYVHIQSQHQLLIQIFPLLRLQLKVIKMIAWSHLNTVVRKHRLCSGSSCCCQFLCHARLLQQSI